MRSIFLALALGAALALPVRANDIRNFDDAALHAVQFVDRDEGWAVGDEGVVWHTIDGGRNWERQPTGVRASLRSVQFLNPFTGWIAGREELPHNGGSVGVLLFTQDGGLRWRRAGINTLPGLNRVRFLDNKTGFVVGDGTDQFPTGIFVTADNGRSWQPVRGLRCPTWLAADFQDEQTGVLAGAWDRMATLRQGALGDADVDLSGGRSVTALQVVGSRAVAVAQGGLVLLSSNGGSRWKYANLDLPPAARSDWDFHGVHCQGEHMWVVGRPGSAVLHSKDQGRTWEVLVTGQPLPLDGVFFTNGQRGWAVGELGSILATQDGGKTWAVQHRGGQRAAILFVHGRASGLPVDTIALLGGQEGYLSVGVRVNGSDPQSAAPGRACEAQRFAAAVRQAGGAAGEMLWQFPVAQHQARAQAPELLRGWDKLHDDRAAEQLLRQLVLALRTWRPDVVITDQPDARATGYPAETLVAKAVQQAFDRAADPAAYPEQIKTLGLEPWKASKLYDRWDRRAGAQVALDLNDPCARLESTARHFATPAAGLLADAPAALPVQRFYRLAGSRIEGAARHRNLMDGIPLAMGGTARRMLPEVGLPAAEVLKAIRDRRTLEAIAEPSAGGLANPDQLLAQVGPSLKTLPDDHAAAAVYAIANQYARMGQWTLARELFLLMVDRYPAHPRTVDAYRWLIQYNSSSEARRRHEMGQFLVVGESEFRPSKASRPLNSGSALETVGATVRGGSEQVKSGTVTLLGNRAETRQWNQGCLEIGSRLAAFGPLFGTDPSIQFCLQAARRNLGDFEPARQWYLQFRDIHADGPWHDAAAAELWLEHRGGLPPKPVATCRQTATRPFLDGKFDDACWQGLKPLPFHNAAGQTDKEYPTEAWLAYDKDFLYLALRCRHPANRHVPPVKVRPRDADLRPYDRVSLMLDLDRDYATYFHLQVDQRGCVCDDCWGDLTWNPRWFVAVHSEPTSWQIEAAIPMIELTGDAVTVGRAWACNLVRVIPGRGVQAFSLPADVQPRPEGMGLLLFSAEGAVKKSE
ncbi:MAG TPA: YCF48-related protein [Gemmataceae bacterium]|jgi:photosystem II stability/assembly factor-like uncharacterized protein|nr:YCF48-related protein [Gemmataceae bacterium]